MTDYHFTDYFENQFLKKRPYLEKEWCVRVLENPIHMEEQNKERFRFWGQIKELEGRFLRVVTLADKTIIHNAFPDRRFQK